MSSIQVPDSVDTLIRRRLMRWLTALVVMAVVVLSGVSVWMVYMVVAPLPRYIGPLGQLVGGAILWSALALVCFVIWSVVGRGTR